MAYEIHVQESDNPYDIVIVPISDIGGLNEQLNDMLQHAGGLQFNKSDSIEDLNRAINNLIADKKSVYDRIGKEEIKIDSIKVIEI